MIMMVVVYHVEEEQGGGGDGVGFNLSICACVFVFVDSMARLVHRHDLLTFFADDCNHIADIGIAHLAELLQYVAAVFL